MRITNFLAICLLTTAACVPGPPRPAPHQPDAGTALIPCDTMSTVTGDKYLDSDAVIDGVPDSCWSLTGKLTLRGAVTSISKLGDLRSVGSLEIDGSQLTTLETKSTFAVTGSIQVTGNAKLADLDRVTASSPTSMIISDNLALTSLGGLVDVDSIHGNLTVSNNKLLTDLTLRSLTSVANDAVGQTISITNNQALTAIDLPSLAAINRLEITNNAALMSIGSLQATVVGDVNISNNQNLSTLGSMSTLTTITDSFTLTGNPALGSLDMFTTSLKNIQGQLTITNNTVLTAQAGEPLAHLTHIGSITITGNKQLQACVAREIDVCVPTDTNSTINNNLQQNTNNCTSWCGR